jgi:hypothetical protein
MVKPMFSQNDQRPGWISLTIYLAITSDIAFGD